MSNKSSTTRQRLLDQSAKLIRRKVIEIVVSGEDPIKVEVRSPTLAQSSMFAAAEGDVLGRARSMAKMVILCTFDADGAPIFTEADEDLILESPAQGGWVSPIVAAMTSLLDEAQANAKN